MNRFTEGERETLFIVGMLAAFGVLVLAVWAVGTVLASFGVSDGPYAIALVVVIVGLPLAFALFIALRALIREGVREARCRLSTWHARQKRPKDGLYR